jgi:hypothetical protein
VAARCFQQKKSKQKAARVHHKMTVKLENGVEEMADVGESSKKLPSSGFLDRSTADRQVPILPLLKILLAVLVLPVLTDAER